MKDLVPTGFFNGLWERDFFTDFNLWGSGRPSFLADIIEEPDKFVIKAELPGIALEDIDISFKNDTLKIKAKREEKTEEKGRNYHRVERSYGSFARNFPIRPEQINVENITATYKRGVLTVILPKRKRKKPTKIDVKVCEEKS